MKVIVVCGSPWSKSESVYSILQSSGLASPSVPSQQVSASIGEWHDKLFAGRQTVEIREPLQPGKAWEQLAGDIFIANWNKPQWGWTDARSSWLLDFWRDFEPDLGFVLVTSRPELSMARAISQSLGAAFESEKIVSSWRAYNHELLRFFSRNRDRCLLMNAEDAATHAAEFAQICSERFGIDLKLPASLDTQTKAPESRLSVLLAKQLIKDFPETESLQLEIDASRHRFTAVAGSYLPPSRSGLSDLDAAIAETRELMHLAQWELQAMKASKEALEQQHGALRSQLSQLTSENDALSGERTSLQSELKQVTASKIALEQQQAALHSQLSQLTTERNALGAERTSLHSELKQITASKIVQEQQQAVLHFQLSQLTAEKNALSEQRSLLQSELAQVTTAKNALEQQYRELQTQLTKITANKEAQELELAALKSSRDEALNNLDETRRTLAEVNESTAGKENDLVLSNQQVTALANENAQLQQRLVDTEQRVQDTELSLEEQKKAASMELSTTRQEAHEQRKENELLTIQLHQVLEELQHYFLRHEELSQNLRQFEERWSRMLKRHPDYLDWSSIDLIASAVSEPEASTRWRITGLFAGNRMLPEFDIEIASEHGNPALVFFRNQTEQGGDAPLLRWPLEAVGQDQLRLQPAGPDTDRHHRWNQLYGLTTTDWKLSIALCGTLFELLNSRRMVQGIDMEPGVEFWVEQLRTLREQLQAISPSWRYDKVILRGQQLNGDYEHLWFRLENVEFGNRHWDLFDFRLGASLIQANGFSLYPKLEFPRAEQGRNQFEHWFVETDDELGPRYELRFALAEHAMDMEVFNRLTVNDQLQMIALVLAIPKFLTQLEADGVKLSRPWQHWQELTTGLIDTLRRNLAAREPERSIETVEPSSTTPASPAPQRGSRRSGSRRR